MTSEAGSKKGYATNSATARSSERLIRMLIRVKLGEEDGLDNRRVNMLLSRPSDYVKSLETSK